MAITDQAEETLIARHIDLQTDDRGPAYARLAEYGTPIWALIGLWQAANGDTERVAKAYDASMEAVHAALAYYWRNKAVVDALILLNNAE